MATEGRGRKIALDHARGDREALIARRARAMSILRAMMTAQHLPQVWLADRLAIHRKRLWNYLRGLNRIPEDLLADACVALGVTVETLYAACPRDILVQQEGEWRGRKPGSKQKAVA